MAGVNAKQLVCTPRSYSAAASSSESGHSSPERSSTPALEVLALCYCPDHDDATLLGASPKSALIAHRAQSQLVRDINGGTQDSRVVRDVTQHSEGCDSSADPLHVPTFRCTKLASAVACPQEEPLGHAQVPPVRRQSAYDTAPPEHSLALSAFRRRTTNAAASPGDDTNASTQRESGHARSEPASAQRLPGDGGQAEARQPPRGDALTLDEFSAAVAAAKLTVSAPTAVQPKDRGAMRPSSSPGL